MDHKEHLCTHLNEIIDHAAGAIVCIDCGLVLSEVFLNSFNYIEDEYNFKNDYILEILSRLNMPEFFKNDILQNLEKISVKFQKNENAIAFVIYKTLNDLSCGVSIKDISSVTGYTDSQIYNFQSSNESIILDPMRQLEKYCILLQLPKNSHSVIKESIEIPKTGHNPTTVLATAIYRYCKKTKINLSMEKIAKTLHISAISIHRYLKFINNESQFS